MKKYGKEFILNDAHVPVINHMKSAVCSSGVRVDARYIVSGSSMNNCDHLICCENAKSCNC